MENLQLYDERYEDVISDYSLNMNIEKMLQFAQFYHNNDEYIKRYLILLMTRIAAVRNADLLSLLGDYYDQGICVKSNEEKATNLFQKAHKEGSTRAAYDLGWYYYIKQEFLSAKEYFIECEKHREKFNCKQLENIYSCLGDIYIEGDKSEIYKGIQYLTISAEKYHSAYAFRKLGRLYSDEKNDKYNPEKAVEYYKNAVKYGDEIAALILGRAYLLGSDSLKIEANLSCAEQIMLPYENGNNPELLFWIGRLFTLKENAQNQWNEAKKFFEKSLEIQTNWLTVSWLGYTCYRLEVYEEAKKYLELANQNGVDEFSDFLGRIYKEGLCGIKDLYLAEKYYKCAYDKDGLNNLFLCKEYLEVLLALEKYEEAYMVAEHGENQYKDIFFVICKNKLIIENKVKDSITREEAAKTFEAIISLDFSEKTEIRLLLVKYYLEQSNYRKAEGQYLELFNEGYADAGVFLGRLYEHGGGSIKANIKVAYEWYEKAKQKGSILAEQELSCFTVGFWGSIRRVKNL